MTLCKRKLILPTYIKLDKERTISYLHQGITKELLTYEDKVNLALAYMSLLSSVATEDYLELLLVESGFSITQSRRLRSLAYYQVDSLNLICN